MTLDGNMPLGVMVSDSWWIRGRVRSVTAVTMVDADPDAKKLPSPPDAVAAVFAACGTIKNTVQLPFNVSPATPSTAPDVQPVRPNPEVLEAVAAVAQDYRATAR